MLEYHRRSGFSLVELSIVLVILGLLVGGILTGQNLIHAAELRAIPTEYSRINAAVHSFRDKYFALPGDMSNAERFWGTMSTGTCPDATAQVGTETCDGDGNGEIDNPSAAARSGELFTFWQHLANAGMIEGRYTGIAGVDASDASVIGENVPPSKFGNAGWSIYDDLENATILVGETEYFEGSYGAWPLTFGGTNPDDPTYEPVLTPEDAWNVDTKVDDGKPGTGMVTVREVDDAPDGCHDQTAGATPAVQANYALSNDSIACNLQFDSR